MLKMFIAITIISSSFVWGISPHLDESLGNNLIKEQQSENTNRSPSAQMDEVDSPSAKEDRGQKNEERQFQAPF